MRLFLIGSVLSALALTLLTACSPGGADAPEAVERDSIKVVGRLVERSPLPDPNSSPYAECLFTAAVVLHEPPPTVPPRIAVAFEGYRERTLTPASHLATNNACRLQLIPFADAPKSVQERQLMDTLVDISLPLYWVQEWAPHNDPLPALATISPNPIPAAAAQQTPPPARSEKEEPLPGPLQVPAIRSDLERIEQQLAARGGDWQAWALDTAATVSVLKRKHKAEQGLSGQIGSNQVELLHFYPYNYSWDPDGELEARALRSFKVLQRSFRELGTDLILAPVPNRDEVVASHFAQGLAAPDTRTELPHPQRLRLLHHLLREDLEVIDLYPALVQGLRTSDDPLFYFGTTDVHPAAGALRISAREIGKRTARYNLPASPPMIQLPVPYTLQVALTGKSQPMFRGYRLASEDGQLLGAPHASPILIFGDSFVKVPGSYGVQSANIAAHLGFETGTIPSYLTRPGGASRMNRILAREPLTFLEGRKAAILFFRIDDLFTSKGEWESFDFLAHRRDIESNFHDFNTRALPVVKYHRTTSWDPWSCEPANGAFPIKGNLGLPASVERRLLRVDTSLPADTYLVFLAIKSQSPSTVSWSFGNDPAQTHPLKLEPGINYLLNRFTAEDSFTPRLDVPAQRGWLSIESVEFRRMPDKP